MKKYIVITLTALLLQGCASTRLCYVERPKETDVSQSMKKGHVFSKDRAIKGKGFDVITRGQIEAKVTTKEGSVVEIKTMKISFLEKMFGWIYMVKPNNISTGGK
jgi:PBP1b-binding outer membrane lipoprotein LpoB